MDADVQSEMDVSWFLRAPDRVSTGMTTNNPLHIGVHRRPSAVNLLFPN